MARGHATGEFRKQSICFADIRTHDVKLTVLQKTVAIQNEEIKT